MYDRTFSGFRFGQQSLAALDWVMEDVVERSRVQSRLCYLILCSKVTELQTYLYELQTCL